MPVTIWLLIAFGIVLVSAFITGLLYSFSGVWERMDNSSKLAARERIRLTQFGCIVIGRRVVVGGVQHFIALALGPYMWMHRRDYGIHYLTSEGFPSEVARQVEGQVMARYRLKLSDDHHFLDGVFIPFRVEFSTEPARVTAMHAQPPSPRKYRRIEMIVEDKVVTVSSSIE